MRVDSRGNTYNTLTHSVTLSAAIQTGLARSSSVVVVPCNLISPSFLLLLSVSHAARFLGVDGGGDSAVAPSVASVRLLVSAAAAAAGQSIKPNHMPMLQCRRFLNVSCMHERRARQMFAKHLAYHAFEKRSILPFDKKKCSAAVVSEGKKNKCCSVSALAFFGSVVSSRGWFARGM